MFPQELWFLLEEHPRQWEISGKEGFPSLPDPSRKFWEEKTITDFPQSQIQGSSAADRAGYFSHQDHRGKAAEAGIKFNPSHLLGEHFSNWKQEQESTWINPSCGTPGTFHLNSIPNQSRGEKSPGFHPHPNIPLECFLTQGSTSSAPGFTSLSHPVPVSPSKNPWTAQAEHMELPFLLKITWKIPRKSEEFQSFPGKHGKDASHFFLKHPH